MSLAFNEFSHMFKPGLFDLRGLWDLFCELDLDGDGYLTREERRVFFS